MEQTNYPTLQEQLWQTVLPNGLTVNLLPKTGFHKNYAILTTDYGSIDDTFVPRGQDSFHHYPAGIAHFLEHKMFEKTDHDAFETFGQFGASANAFTSFTQTSYLFSATRELKNNLMTLLDFVQDPYFTAKTVNKEKGIIGQEIQMYDDDPSWRLYFGLIGNLYHNHPLQADIAGTKESIAKLTADDLYAAYETFYHPSNMNLFVTGDFDPETIATWVADNQAAKQFPEALPIKRQLPATIADGSDIIPYRAISMPVSRAKTMVGLKGLDTVPSGRNGLRYQATVQLLLELLFGELSQDYLQLYDAGVLDDTFGYDFELARGFHFATFSGDTNDPQRLDAAIIDILEHAEERLQTAADQFAQVQKEFIGRALFRANSLEALANSYEPLFAGTTLLDLPAIYQSLTLSEVVSVAKELIRTAAISEYQITPTTD